MTYVFLRNVGSHLAYTSRSRVSRSTNMFGTMLVVLPSMSKGGPFFLRYGEHVKEFDCVSKDLCEVTVMAWYTSVSYEMHAISSSYRLVLSYDLVYTSPSILPSVPSHSHWTAFLDAIRPILIDWKQEQKFGPDKVVIGLKNTYPADSVCGDILYGPDTGLLELLCAAADEIGIRVGFAVIKHKLGGPDEPDFPFPKPSYLRLPDDDDYEEGRFTWIEQIKRADGTVVKEVVDEVEYGQMIPEKAIDFDEHRESVPLDLLTSIEENEEPVEDQRDYMTFVRFEPPVFVV